MVPLPERFAPTPDTDEATPLTEADPTAEPLGEAGTIEPTAEGTEGGAAVGMSADEWADLVSTPGNYQRLAEAPRAEHAAILGALMAKADTRAKQVADLAARDAWAKGIEEGRNAMARELVVQNIDKMESYERDELFRQNPGAEELWHESKAKKAVTQAPAATNFVQQIVDQGNAQLKRLENHPEYKPVFDEMVQGKYAADPGGLAQLAARVERALATNQVIRDDAEATAKNRAAALLKSGPKTVGVGMGGAAPAALTADSVKAMTTEQIFKLIKDDPAMEKRIDALFAAV